MKNQFINHINHTDLNQIINNISPIQYIQNQIYPILSFLNNELMIFNTLFFYFLKASSEKSKYFNSTSPKD